MKHFGHLGVSSARDVNTENTMSDLDASKVMWAVFIFLFCVGVGYSQGHTGRGAAAGVVVILLLWVYNCEQTTVCPSDASCPAASCPACPAGLGGGLCSGFSGGSSHLSPSECVLSPGRDRYYAKLKLAFRVGGTVIATEGDTSALPPTKGDTSALPPPNPNKEGWRFHRILVMGQSIGADNMFCAAIVDNDQQGTLTIELPSNYRIPDYDVQNPWQYMECYVTKDGVTHMGMGSFEITPVSPPCKSDKDCCKDPHMPCFQSCCTAPGDKFQECHPSGSCSGFSGGSSHLPRAVYYGDPFQDPFAGPDTWITDDPAKYRAWRLLMELLNDYNYISEADHTLIKKRYRDKLPYVPPESVDYPELSWAPWSDPALWDPVRYGQWRKFWAEHGDWSIPSLPRPRPPASIGRAASRTAGRVRYVK